MNKRILGKDNRRSISVKRADAERLDAAWRYLCQVMQLKPAQVAVVAILLLAAESGFEFEEQGNGDNDG